MTAAGRQSGISSPPCVPWKMLLPLLGILLPLTPDFLWLTPAVYLHIQLRHDLFSASLAQFPILGYAESFPGQWKARERVIIQGPWHCLCYLLPLPTQVYRVCTHTNICTLLCSVPQEHVAISLVHRLGEPSVCKGIRLARNERCFPKT